VRGENKQRGLVRGKIRGEKGEREKACSILTILTLLKEKRVEEKSER